ncbi:type II toxin-antitoxin system VapC family toxin [Chitinimonas koreensis]|uniref:type II toxin-antitoxin system VapC family toxin n=1 Tax=Chitinimonas koreensis TaxID=356302 RepID=UPI0003F8E9C9|nr:PIN domain-containing protein [Chitinimonas koreensis]QNM98818.1 PIN domain-containing protein [Chitinimonas koreensis]
MDANVVIYLIEAFPEYYERVEAVLRAVVAADAVLVSSELTLAEVLVQPLRQEQAAIAQAYDAFLTGGEVELVPIDRTILRQAAALRAETRMKLPDALHIASAVASWCSWVVSHDVGLRLPAGLMRLPM